MNIKRVKEEIKKELEDLRDRMMPHANKVTQTFGENMQKLQEIQMCFAAHGAEHGVTQFD